jgi:hypothetical protein
VQQDEHKKKNPTVVLVQDRGVLFLGVVRCVATDEDFMGNPSTPSAQDEHTYRKRSADIYVQSCLAFAYCRKHEILRLRSQ